ncbi:MAG TPA: secretion system protein [Chloroflexus aurantiacus]|jgi:tight adherence protein B|uniref:Type II secretion system protein n=1 Tax=Chloroflexus aurantiacus (strain ATCC 29366 / DSM 635 / J-10-fl) TaxID=324602 RepID=A9WE99_CHLAA|nr:MULTISPECIES: type II secretion system F family protein [Chloroflexus]ABY33759.1 type II secretion system protein [Chloroflexus aurantiacus J-10-fl]RMG52782.1 MAG: secretion system protein [Chloroflexota bacterium]GIV94388.1 MAG: secretion system protein [Chloroflexus sp.]HBW68208.1 secretion system protein [Chloroflexus aurantiacus]
MDLLLSPEMMPVTLGALGLLLFLLVITVVVLMRQSATADVAQRLETFAGGKAQERSNEPIARQAIERIDAVVAKSKQGSSIQRELARADLKLTVAEFIGLKLGAALLGVVFGFILGRANFLAQIGAATAAAIVFSFLPNLYVNMRAAQRIKAFNNQLGDVITMMANALRGGYSFLQTLDMVSREAPPPAATEFRRVVQEVGLGRSTEEALQNLLRRMPSDDLDLLITAVTIQMEVGGNLAQILDTIGHTIRERVRIKGEISTLTAQGRISSWIITGLPIGLAMFITVVNPDYMAPLFTFGFPPQAWCCMPVASLFMIAMGYFAIQKIIDIEV